MLFHLMVLEESKTEKPKILTNFNYLSRAATSPVGEFTVSSLVTLSSCLAWIFLKPWQYFLIEVQLHQFPKRGTYSHCTLLRQSEIGNEPVFL